MTLATTLLTPGLAQDSGLSGGLRGTSSPGTGLGSAASTTAPDPGTAPAAPNAAQGVVAPRGDDPPRPGTLNRRAARTQTRRSHQPTAAQVRVETRSTIVPTAVLPPVQPPQTGLPDISPAPAPLPRKKPLTDDPYAPVGLRVGNINLFPVIGESIGYDSNPNRVDRTSAGSKGSFVSQTEGELKIQSDWSRHELTGSLRGAYDEYPDQRSANRPEGAGNVALRLDVLRDTIVTTEGHYQLDTQRSDSPDLNAVVRERPIVNTEGGSVGVTQKFNRLALTLRGTYDRTDYADAILSDGSVLDQGDRNYNQYGARLRLAYEFNPGFIPFVEGLGDMRDYDRRIDNSGYRRSSTGAGARVGTTFELTRLVTGEIGVGAIERQYDDPRLKNLTSPLVDASIVWAATPITNVRLGAQTTVDETTVIGSNGVIDSRLTLEVAHDLRRNLTITPAITLFENDYKGVSITERGYSASLRADYRLTRQVAIRASYLHEELKSSVVGSDYSANVFLVGMRLQP